MNLEISPDSKSQVIKKEIDGITFNFCLLNEQGQPATVFKEGENFSFHFSITNKTDKKLFFFPDFAYSDTERNNFCEVFMSDGEKVGKPFVFLGYDKIGIGAYPFNPSQSYIFEQQWIDHRNSIWRWKYGHYESSNQKHLPAGNYFTQFQSRFEIQNENTGYLFLDTTLTFKINFQIR
jgi:hypothetical protein